MRSSRVDRPERRIRSRLGAAAFPFSRVRRAMHAPGKAGIILALCQERGPPVASGVAYFERPDRRTPRGPHPVNVNRDAAAKRVIDLIPVAQNSIDPPITRRRKFVKSADVISLRFIGDDFARRRASVRIVELKLESPGKKARSRGQNY